MLHRQSDHRRAQVSGACLSILSSSVESELQLGNVLFHKWRAKFGDNDTSLMARMNELREESPL